MRVDRALAWIDGLVARVLPAEVNPLARAGAAANVALIVAVVSGIALLIWYSPSVHSAYASLEAVRGHTLGGWVRALHRYSSDLAMLLLIVHAGRTFFARKFSGARWLAWISGVVMLALVWFIGWTGYWLVWDQPAQQVAVSSMRLLDALPVFGEPLGRLYLADRLVPSLLFFVVFFLHMLLPLGIAIGLALHLARVSRAQLLPNRALSLALIAGMAIAAVLVPAPIDAPARMAEKAEGFTVDAWYLAPLALGLRFQHAGLWVALLGTSAAGAALPWLLGRRRRRPAFQAVVESSRCHACTQCAQDCPFDAIRMVPRTDGKPFASVAQVDPARCVGCGVCAGSCDSEGISIPWFDTRREENRIAHDVAAARDGGAGPWAALVCGDIDGGLGRFDAAKWRERLPGYVVEAVPTSSWVRPKFVERLLARGMRGVLVVRDARFEAWSRDGARWVADRLLGQRAPKFRPARVQGGMWRVIDFDPSSPGELTRAATGFQQVQESGLTVRRLQRWKLASAGLGLAVLLGVATVVPSMLRVRNPVPPGPEFILSFKALGEWIEAAPYDPAQDANKPIHMRGRSTEKPHRAPVRIRVTVNGATEERVFSGKGLSSDGPAIGEWGVALGEGPQTTRVEIGGDAANPPWIWEGVFPAGPRWIYVLTFDPAAGFREEWREASDVAPSGSLSR